MSLDYFDCKHYLHTHFPEYPICDDNLANALTHIPIRPMSSFLLTGLPSQTGRQFAEAISHLRYDLIKQHAHSASNELSTKVKTISPHSPYTVTDDISTFCKSHPYGTVVIDFDDLAYTQNTGKILSGFLVKILKNRSCAGVSLSHNYFIILANQNIKLITLSLRVHTDFTFTFSKPTKSKHHQKSKYISAKHNLKRSPNMTPSENQSYEHFNHYLLKDLGQYPINCNDIAMYLNTLLFSDTKIYKAPVGSSFLFTSSYKSVCYQFASDIGHLRSDIISKRDNKPKQSFSTALSFMPAHHTIHFIKKQCKANPYATIVIDLDQISSPSIDGVLQFLYDIAAVGDSMKIDCRHNSFILLAHQLCLNNQFPEDLKRHIGCVVVSDETIAPKQIQRITKPKTKPNTDTTPSSIERDLKASADSPTEVKFVEQLFKKLHKCPHSFGYAMNALKHGHTVTQLKWKGYWFIPDSLTLTYHDKTIHVPNKNHIIFAKLRDHGGYAPAMAYQVDMLADDWIVLD